MLGVEDAVRDSELLLDSLSSAPSCNWRLDVDVQGRLERRWSLWHEFMKEHAHLEAWLRLAEEAVSPLYSAHVPYADAKEALKKFERLRREAGARLVQLDGLTQRNRTLAQMFQGVMRARLLTVTRESGRRWDDVNVRLEAVTGRLQMVLSPHDCSSMFMSVFNHLQLQWGSLLYGTFILGVT
uniref:Nesprin-2-like n=1 Tax=Gouania willdenowi TaxID=441366 RepID=A0A8C5DT94_GOUWI